MSSSATYYRISQDIFGRIENSIQTRKFDRTTAKEYVTLQQTSSALEYLLSKFTDSSSKETLDQLFNPLKYLGEAFDDNLSIEEQLEIYENGSIIPYIDIDMIDRIKNVLEKVKEADLVSKYDCNELNTNGIYPGVWHNDDSQDMAFNIKHILDDFIPLKKLIINASEEKDFVFVFIG